MSAEIEERRKRRSRQAEDSDEEVDDREYNEERMQTYMSDEANKDVRDKYDRLMAVIHNHADEDRRMDMHELQLLVLEANEAFGDVKRPREAALDAQLLKKCWNLSRHTIELSQSNLIEFKPREFAEKLITYATREEEEDTEVNPEASIFLRLSKKIPSKFNLLPGLQPLFCAIDGEKPVVAQKKTQRKKQAQHDLIPKEARKVTALNENQGEEEAEALSWMNKTLKHSYAAANNASLPFFEFAVDPTSFSRTVENLFHISLLVREQYAELLEEEDGLPHIRPTRSISTTDKSTEGKQCIFSMDKEEWDGIVKAFNITRAMIPPRTQSKQSRKKKK